RRLPSDDRQRVGVGRRHFRALSRIRVRSVQGILGAFVRTEDGLEGWMLDNPLAPDPQYLAQLLQAPPPQHLRRLQDRGALGTELSLPLLATPRPELDVRPLVRHVDGDQPPSASAMLMAASRRVSANRLFSTERATTRPPTQSAAITRARRRSACP